MMLSHFIQFEHFRVPTRTIRFGEYEGFSYGAMIPFLGDA